MVEFLTRPGCHLCHEALPIVEAAAKRARAEIRVVDIDRDDLLVARYGLRIPVVITPDGVVLAEGQIEKRALIEAFRSLRRSETRRPRLLRRRR